MAFRLHIPPKAAAGAFQVLLITLANLTGAAENVENVPPRSAADRVLQRRLDEADQQHRARAYHLEAEALEKALAVLEPRDPLRTATAHRLIRLYRGGMGRFERAAYWVRTIADELRPTPEGIDALFDLGDTEYNHGHIDQALAIYNEILDRIVAPDPPWDRFDRRCWRGWHGEKLAKYPKGTDPLFPSNIEVPRYLSRFLQLLQSRAWFEVCVLLESKPPLRSPFQQTEEPKMWTSARQWLSRTLNDLSPNSLRTLQDSCRSGIHAVTDKEDWRALRRYRFYHPLPEVESQIDVAIGDALLNRNMPALASLHYGRALESMGQNAAPLLVAKHQFSRIVAGEKKVGEPPDLEVEIGGERRSLRASTDTWSTQPQPRETIPPPANFEQATVSRLPLIRAPIPLNDWQIRWIEKESLELPRFADEVVACVPVGSRRCVVMNLGSCVQAVDAVDGRSLWTFFAPEENSMAFSHQRKESIVECARAGTAALDGERVFCNLIWGHHDTPRYAGGTFALRRSDGAVLWSTVHPPELARMQMIGELAVYQGVVVSLAWDPHEAIPLFYVVGMAAETGEVLWLTHLFSGSSLTVRDDRDFYHRPVACGAPAVADGVAYLNTAAGVIAAVNVVDGSLVWAIAYPRIKGINESEWATRMAISRPAGIVAVYDDVVLFAPIDSHLLLAVDRFSGELRYMKENLDLRAIAAADSRHAYLLEGISVRAIRPGDGDTVWERKLPTNGIVGVPTLSARGIWCSTWEALYLLEPSSGEIIQRRGWEQDEACGSILDLGDRLVGASQTSAYVLSDHALDAADRRFVAPRAEEKGESLRAASRVNQWLRWVLPSVDRGDFILSDADRDHLVTRSEMIQMRRTNPIPSLRWERPSPLPWDYEMTFDPSRVAVWDRSHLFVLDATSGRSLWEDHPAEALKEAPGWGAVLHGDNVLWWGARQVHCYSAATGEKRWVVRPHGTIHGLRPSARGVGVYLEGGGNQALLLGWETGKEVSRIPIPRATPAPRHVAPGRRPPQLANLPPLIAGRKGASVHAPTVDYVLVNGVAPARIDWLNRTASVGAAIEYPVRGVGFGVRLEVYGKYLCLRGQDSDWPHYQEALIAVWDRATLSRIGIPPAQRWCVKGHNLYTFFGHRVTCTDLRNGQSEWRSFAIKEQCRLIMATEDHVVLVTQRGWFGEDEGRDVCHVRILDAHSGEQIKDFRIPKRWLHYLDQQPGRVVMWDCSFLYMVEAPVTELSDGNGRLTRRTGGVDADAIAALRMARDLENAPRLEVQRLAVPPRIDGDLTDWEGAEVRRLDTIMDWKPDFAHQSYLKPRCYGGTEDHSASIRIGKAGDSYYLAAEVIDDVHVADPVHGLWRSDSVTLYCAGAQGAEVDPTMLTVALAGGVPRFELGTAAAGIAASDPPGYDPELRPGARNFVLSPLVSAGSVRIPPGTPVEVAIERDEASGRTVYELKVARAAWPIDSGMFWDVIINDDDGHGREGGLQLASSVWGVEETAIGGIQGEGSRAD